MTAVELTPAEQAAANAAVAALRARSDVEDVGGLLGDGAPQDGPYDGTPRHENPTEMRDRLAAEQDEREVEDFGAFWSTRKRTGKTLRNVVPGVDVTLPAALPLAFEIEARRLQDATDSRAIHRVFGLLFGEGTLAQLIAGGLDTDQLPVIIAWGSANAAGKDMTLAQAEVEVERMKRAKDRQGKAAPAGGTPLFGTGHSSRPTSRGNTGSRKKKSKR